MNATWISPFPNISKTTTTLFFSEVKLAIFVSGGKVGARYTATPVGCQTSELPSEWSIEQIVGSDQLATSKFEELARHCYRGAERGDTGYVVERCCWKWEGGKGFVFYMGERWYGMLMVGVDFWKWYFWVLWVEISVGVWICGGLWGVIVCYMVYDY